MNRGDLVAFVKNHANLDRAESERALSAVIEGIAAALQKKEEVTLVGFGTFSTVDREAREGRNPRTGEKLQIAKTRLVKFRPGKALRDAIAKFA